MDQHEPEKRVGTAASHWKRLAWVFVAVLGAAPTITFLVLWLQAREDLRDERSKSSDLREQLDDEKQRTKELASENKRLKRMQPLLEMFGESLTFYRKLDFREDKRKVVPVGDCYGLPCFVVKIEDYELEAAEPTVTLSVSSPAMIVPKSDGTVEFGAVTRKLPLQKGCRWNFPLPWGELELSIEDDRVESLSLGLFMRPGKDDIGGFSTSDCPQ